MIGCLLFVVCILFVFFERSSLNVVGCLLLVVCCLWFVACCSSLVVPCDWVDDCRLLIVVCCVLLVVRRFFFRSVVFVVRCYLASVGVPRFWSVVYLRVVVCR